MVMAFRKPEPIPVIFIIGATLLLGGLGVWQLKRLAWKETVIAQVEQVQELPALRQIPPPANMAKAEYRRITLAGRFLHEKELHKASKYHGNQAGYHILTPFRPSLRAPGKEVTILVNRGWVPASMKERDKRPDTVAKTDAMVSGLLVLPQKKNPFLPANDAAKNVWLYDDLAEMEKATGLTLYPMQIVTTGNTDIETYPIPSDGKINLRNDHLGYATTWFALMVIGLVMFALYYRIPPQKK